MGVHPRFRPTFQPSHPKVNINVFGMIWRMQEKTVEGEEASISAVLRSWFRPRFRANCPKWQSSKYIIKCCVEQKHKSSYLWGWNETLSQRDPN